MPHAPPICCPAQAVNRSNFTGKQMMTTRLKDGKTNDVYFEKKHNWIFDGDKFRDRMMYQVCDVGMQGNAPPCRECPDADTNKLVPWSVLLSLLWASSSISKQVIDPSPPTHTQETQKEKKKGFLSGDFKRKDEFSMTFRMEQYREQLKQESTRTKEVRLGGT